MPKRPTWALVANPARARILRGLERPVDPVRPPSELVYRARSPWLTACLRRPHAGRATETGLAAIGADLCQFAGDLAPFLNAHRLAGDFARLSLWAPERLLGMLCAQMPAGLRACVILAAARDLTGLDETELRVLIRGEIARL